ncbi:GATOR complex protein NPRL3 isoform X6 [Mustela lutreola]|uniref:GATOR complex protein NPRL3 isoform X6 n=1 Tax=Mustela lutreola TaxID=9666 RepID=UPI0027977676|nr:GATOR complex protein NPRL3 isoform X6 [Mustela lutreola]
MRAAFREPAPPPRVRTDRLRLRRQPLPRAGAFCAGTWPCRGRLAKLAGRGWWFVGLQVPGVGQPGSWRRTVPRPRARPRQARSAPRWARRSPSLPPSGPSFSGTPSREARSTRRPRQANADPSVINCLHTLSRRIATVLQHEERRCQYLTREAKLILALQDEVSAMADASDGPQSPFHHILPKCKLARDLKEAYDSLCTSGVVRLHVNSWLEVSFCLPHKIHYAASSLIPPEAIERSLKAIRPYHALLLLSDEKSLLGELPLDCSPALVRVIKTTSAVKNLQQLAQDADLALLQVFQLAAHLVYWGKAIIIYPLCENNVYMLSPNASVCLYSPLAEQFSRQFPAHDLPSVLAKFSLPVSLSEFRNPLAPPVQETQLIQMVVWMLQHRLLVQLHTYVCLMASPSEEEPHAREDEVPFTARVGGRSLSTPNALSFGSPSRSPLPRASVCPSMDNSSAELLPGGDSPLNKRMTENLLASLSEHERAAILSVPAAQNPEDLRMFARLLHYFRGRHHLEEIMYNENTRRSQLLTLFDKFRSVLVVTAHEDPVIAVFQALLP